MPIVTLHYRRGPEQGGYIKEGQALLAPVATTRNAALLMTREARGESLKCRTGNYALGSRLESQLRWRFNLPLAGADMNRKVSSPCELSKVTVCHTQRGRKTRV